MVTVQTDCFVTLNMNSHPKSQNRCPSSIFIFDQTCTVGLVGLSTSSCCKSFTSIVSKTFASLRFSAAYVAKAVILQIEPNAIAKATTIGMTEAPNCSINAPIQNDIVASPTQNKSNVEHERKAVVGRT